MKIVNILICLALLLGSIFIMESLVIKPSTTEVTVLWDVTDTTIGKPGSDEIIRLYHLEGDGMWYGAKFRFSTLSNVNFNHVEVLSLPSRNKWLSNELERQKEIRVFFSQIALLMDTPQAVPVGRPHSSIYWPLFAELKRLGRQSGEIGLQANNERILVIQSDLIENNDLLSLYDPNQLQAFVTDPKSSELLVENIAQLPLITGIEVYMLYSPMDAMDSNRYTLISNVLKNILEEKGAKVYRSANLIR